MAVHPSLLVDLPGTPDVYAAAAALATSYPVVVLPAATPLDPATTAAGWERLCAETATHERDLAAPPRHLPCKHTK